MDKSKNKFDFEKFKEKVNNYDNKDIQGKEWLGDTILMDMLYLMGTSYGKYDFSEGFNRFLGDLVEVGKLKQELRNKKLRELLND